MDRLAFDQQIGAFLAICRTCSLATVDEYGLPHAANVQYASDSAWRLCWISKAEAAHSQHLHDQPAIAITIYAHQDTPEEIHGLQLKGKAAVVNEADRDVMLKLYQAKYPFTADLPYREALERQQLYCFTPTWLRWIDNRQGFGFKIEKDLAEG